MAIVKLKEVHEATHPVRLQGGGIPGARALLLDALDADAASTVTQ